MSVSVTDIRIPTPKGHTLGATRFTKDHPQKTLVISSATGVLQRYYADFATYLAEHGYAVYTFDYHGIGKSDSEIQLLKQNTSNAADWGSNDQASLLVYAKAQHPNNKLYLLTHSIGGQILGFNANIDLVDKMVLVSAQSGYWKYYKGWVNLPKMLLFWYAMIPGLTSLYGYFPAKKLGLFENLPKPMALQWMRWGKHPEYMLGHHRHDELYFNTIECPVLGLGFPRDVYAPKAATD